MQNIGESGEGEASRHGAERKDDAAQERSFVEAKEGGTAEDHT